MGIELFARSQLLDPLDGGAVFNLIQGDQHRARNHGNLSFGWIAHIDQHQAAGVSIEQSLELLH